MLGIVGFACSFLNMGGGTHKPSVCETHAADMRAAAVVDTAIVRMGGAAALRAIHTVRYDMVTQWLSTSYDARPFQDAPGYEMHTDIRDYDTRVWRNTRRFSNGTSWTEMVDLVLDTVAARHGVTSASVATPAGVIDGWAPLNIAYIDERRELFAFAPERLLLLMRNAPDLHSLPDTVLGAIRHHTVAATIDGYHATVFVRSSDGFLAMARYHADESNDFGLAPWGPMDVEVWYSRWRYDPAVRVAIPQQLDVMRVGKPYKRTTVLAAKFNDPLPNDSLTFGEPVRAAYLAQARRPMADLPLDSARIVGQGRITAFRTPGAPLAALKIGDEWLLIEPGNLPLNAERAAAWLSSHDVGSRVIGGIVGGASPSGGAAWLARQGMTVYTAPAGAKSVPLSLHNYGAPIAASRTITSGEWVRSGGTKRDSVWVEPIDLPNSPQTLVLYVPSMRWAYSSKIGGPIELRFVVALARSRGWKVDSIGSPANPEGVPLNGVGS